MSRHLARALVLLVGAALVASCSSGSSTSTNQTFSGTTIRVVTFTGPQIAEPLQRRAPDFEKATGAKVQIITVPFSDLYQKLLTDFATKTNSYDATVFDPQWMGDYVPSGYLEDLTDRVQKDSALQWSDIAPFFRDFSATFKGKVYTVPLDGDFQMVYYRKDLLQKDGLQPPATWDEVEAAAKKLVASGAKCGFSAAWPSWTLMENMHAVHDQPFSDHASGFDGLEQRAIVGAHELEAAEVVEVHPAIHVLEPGRELAPALARPAVDIGRRARVEVLDDHVEHPAMPPPPPPPWAGSAGHRGSRWGAPRAASRRRHDTR